MANARNQPMYSGERCRAGSLNIPETWHVWLEDISRKHKVGKMAVIRMALYLLFARTGKGTKKYLEQEPEKIRSAINDLLKRKQMSV